MKQGTELTNHGRDIMNQLEKGLADKVINRLKELDENLPYLVTDYAFGSVVGRPGLDLKTREMLTVASLVSLGNAPQQLELHMRGALNVGVTPEELLEVVIQMAVYAGVPACMNGLTAYRSAIAATENSFPITSRD
ncbi:carboxymuconolactone decarboxylase family protein [Xenorhabdus thuongxuanensis]|uniref:Carboxymuconolactone decarboxylase n=1 Tax=Xenorhabdus thuongxuanensis TaxID=1873484 RepID=A0A1Q5TYY3_9GAMM|nr:carboxymuconolactone decarboxylase family protein [Xenorhabdus thuongxuanensis]OKP05425.1 carboxymuconolactone decarboxylase [Xenorhabdus thuongxuanensis]